MEYTQETKKAIDIAKKLAESNNYKLIGTEHLLVGLFYSTGTIASKSLLDSGVTSEICNSLLSNYSQEFSSSSQSSGQMDFSPRSKKALALARNYASQFGFQFVTPEYLLIGILSIDDSNATRGLRKHGIEVETLMQNMLKNLSSNLTLRFKINPVQQGKPSIEFGDKKSGPKGQAPNDGGMYYDEMPEEGDVISQFCVNLNQKAIDGKLDPVIGRKKEIQRVIQILSRRTKNNPVLIGEPGVGKSAIAEGLAQAIVNNKVPETLANKKVMSLDLAGMVAGTRFRGDFEERLKNMVNEVKKDGSIILFIDEIHMIVKAGSTSDGAMDAANILKPALSRGELQTIGATTIDEYRKHIEKDAALERRFMPILVEAPSVEETILILNGLKDKYEAHHGVIIEQSAIEAAAELSDKYVSDRFLPDKAIDLIDEASSKKKILSYVTPDDIKVIEKELSELEMKKEYAIKQEDYKSAGEIHENYVKLRKELDDKKLSWTDKVESRTLSIDANDIAQIVSDWTHIPVVKITETESEKLLKLEGIIKERVIGQDEAVSAVCKAIRRARAGLKDINKPIGSFIFLGPTGVGKTELSKALAEAMFGNENALLRVDMSEYMDKISVSKLIGAAPGYVGYEEGGQLTEMVRRKPYSVVLFDEIEKAHVDVFNLFLQIMDEGALTDSQGRKVSFKNVIIIMTSNLGAQDIVNSYKLGFGAKSEEQDYEELKEKQLDSLKKTMRPEFLNRLDETIVFRPLDKTNIASIADIMIDNLGKKLQLQKVKITVSPSAKEYIVKHGYSKDYGARPLKRIIQKNIENELADLLIAQKIKIGDHVLVDAKDGKLVYKVKKEKKPKAKK